jgi:hypothetical protein
MQRPSNRKGGKFESHAVLASAENASLLDKVPQT